MKLPFANYVKAHHISRAALGVGTLVAAVVFFVLGAGIRLLVGPVSLGPLAGTIDGAIQQALPGISLQYDQAAIEWSRDEGRVNLVVLGARILDSSGHVVVMAPKADIDLAAAPFLKGEFAVKRITLVGVQLTLVHMKDGRIRLGERDNDVLTRIDQVIQARGSTTSSLQSFAVRDAHLAVFDENTGLSLMAPHASLALTSKGDAIGINFNTDVQIEGRAAHIKADLTLPQGKGPYSGDATITGLDLRSLGARAPFFADLRDVALIVDLSTRFAVAPGGHITRADFDMSATGELPTALLGAKVLHVRRLRLTGAYDGIKNHLALPTADLNAKEAVLHLKGSGDLHYDTQGVLQAVSAELSSGRVVLDLPGMFDKPVGLQSAALKGTWQTGPRRFDVEKLALLGPGLNLSLKGTVTMGEPGQTPGVAVSGAFGPMTLQDLLHYWPLPVAPGTREWIAGNIFAGTTGPLLFETHFTPGLFDSAVWPDEAMKLSFAVEGVEGNYVTGLTHLTGVSGNAVLLGDSFSADFTSGRVGNIILRGGRVVIPTLHITGTAAVISAHADGAMGDIMRLIDMKPLNYPTRFGIDPEQTKGQAGVDMSFTVPMLASLPVDDVGISVKAQVSDFAVTLGKSTRLTNGAVVFEIDNAHLHQTGQVNLADSRLTVDWTEDFKTTAPVTTRLNVKGLLTEAARAALDMGMATILTGPIPVNAEIQGHRGTLQLAEANIDLTPAAIGIPILNLGKPAGVAAGGHITVNFGAGASVHDEVIRLTGPNLSATGTAQFGADGGLSVLNFTSLKMGALNDLSVILTRTAAGDDYNLRGHSLDGSMIGRNGAAPPAGSSAAAAASSDISGPFHINARLDRLAMRHGVTIAPFNLDLAGIGNRPSALNLSGSLSKTANIRAVLETNTAGRKLTLEAGDAGQLLHGLFDFEDMRGGKLTLTATLPGRASDPDATGAAPDFTGKLDIDNFTMVHQAFLTRLFSAGSLTGLGDLMGGDGLSIENLDVPFTSKNNVISLHNAVAHGRAIGATADGYIDRPKGLVDLKGSLSPAYGLNSMLGNVPLLGNLLTSKKGEGIFGVTYTATGSADQPRIQVNPLSILAPGILRRAFEGRMPNAANAPSNAPAPAQPQTAQSNAAGTKAAKPPTN